MTYSTTMNAQTARRADTRVGITVAGQFAPTSSRPPVRRRRSPMLRSVRSFVPSEEEIVGQDYDLANIPVADVLDLIQTRFTAPMRAALRTTISNSRKLDAQGYKLVALGQMVYRVEGGEQTYFYDHATERCTCPLNPVLGTCKHSIWAAMKITAAAALMVGEGVFFTAPNPLPVNRPAPKSLGNPWASSSPVVAVACAPRRDVRDERDF